MGRGSRKQGASVSGQFVSDQAAWPPTGGCFCLVFEVFLLVELAGTSSAPNEWDLVINSPI